MPSFVGSSILRFFEWLRSLLELLSAFFRRPRWEKLAPAGASPAERFEHTAVYDPGSNRMIVFGGKTLTGVEKNANDVWILKNATAAGGSPPAWEALAPTGPAPAERHMATAVYDHGSNRMIVFGGHVDVFTNDVWVLEHANGLGGTSAWLELSPSGPAPVGREWHTAVYDAAANRMIVFGGTAFPLAPLNDVWVLEHANGLGGTAAWIQLTPSAAAPTPRTGHSAVYDSANNRMLVFGGAANGNWGPYFNDVWALLNANGLGGTPAWKTLASTGTLPPVREDQSAVYDAAHNRIVSFAGWRYTGTDEYFNDVWMLKRANGLSGPSTWSQIVPGGPSPAPRELHTAIFDPGLGRMVVFGGASPTGTSGKVLQREVWLLHNAGM